MKKLDGKKAVITGAASGFGRALALALRARGAASASWISTWRAPGRRCAWSNRRAAAGRPTELDVQRADDWEAMADHFFRSWGGVDVLVNNAGVVSVGNVGDVPMENWEWIFSINFWGVIFGCHTFVPAEGAGRWPHRQHGLRARSHGPAGHGPLQHRQGGGDRPERDPAERTARLRR